MPIFEYKCRGCGRKFEFYQRGGETPACPTCGSKDLSKIFSTFSARMKGGSSSAGSSSIGGGCASCSGGRCSTCK